MQSAAGSQGDNKVRMTRRVGRTVSGPATIFLTSNFNPLPGQSAGTPQRADESSRAGISHVAIHTHQIIHQVPDRPANVFTTEWLQCRQLQASERGNSLAQEWLLALSLWSSDRPARSGQTTVSISNGAIVIWSRSPIYPANTPCVPEKRQFSPLW